MVFGVFCGVDVPAGSNECIQVTNGISEVRMIEHVEELSPKFEGLCLRYREELRERQVQIQLSRTRHAVSANTTYICAGSAGGRHSPGARNGLPRLNNRPDKDRRVEEIAPCYALGSVFTGSSSDEAWTGQRICSICESVEGACPGVDDVDWKAGHGGENGRGLPVPNCRALQARLSSKGRIREPPYVAQHKAVRTIEVRHAAVRSRILLIAKD